MGQRVCWTLPQRHTEANSTWNDDPYRISWGKWELQHQGDTTNTFPWLMCRTLTAESPGQNVGHRTLSYGGKITKWIQYFEKTVWLYLTLTKPILYNPVIAFLGIYCKKQNAIKSFAGRLQQLDNGQTWK